MTLGELIGRHAGWVLAAVFAATLLALAVLVDPGTGRVRLVIEPGIESLLPEDDPERTFLDETRQRFGADDSLVLGFATEDLFTTDALERIDQITRRLTAMEEIRSVTSLTTAVNVVGTEEGLEIGPFVAAIPRDAEGLAALRAAVMDNPFTSGSLVAEDEAATALLLTLVPLTSREYQEREVSDRVLAIAYEAAGDAEIWLTGGPHLGEANARVLVRETLLLPGLILAAVSLVLLLAFRTVRGVLLPLATVAVAVVWTLAFVVATGHGLNAITVLVPVLLTTLGISYAIHVVSEYYEVEAESPAARAGLATSQVQLPVLLTGLTTAIGFATLVLSPLPAVREFGVLSVIGVGFTVVAALTLTPAVLAFLPLPKRLPPATGRSESVAARVAHFAVRRRPWIFGAFAATLAIALLGAASIRVGSDQIRKFPADAPVRQDFEAVNERLGGANPLLIVLEGETRDTFKRPEHLQEIEALQAWLAEDPSVGETTSLVDHLKLLNRGFHENDPESFVLPERQRLVSQILLFGESRELRNLVDVAYQRTIVRVRAKVIDSDEVTALSRRIDARLAELPDSIDARVTGTSIIVSGALDQIIRGQTRAVLAAFVIIYLVLAALFVSFRVGLVALLPNVVPVGVYFGALGWSGVSLNPGTSLIAPIVLGIAVDDTIHYFARFIRDAKRLGDEEAATAATLAAVGPPVTVTSMALCVGFLCMLASDLSTQREIGVLAAFALAFAWLTDVTLTPALCARMRIVTLWDLVSLDLGEDPRHSIGLFEGLREAQARIVALMGTLITAPAGRRLFHAGEPADGMYVVIAGTVRSWVDAGDRNLVAALHDRGDTIGEAGLFHGEHTTNAEVVEDARLLRLSQAAIDGLARRYPRIAAVLFRNTNRILASRMALTTRGQHLGEVFARRELRWSEHVLTADASLGDEALHASLRALGIHEQTLRALGLIPLVQVAWADGQLDARERAAILDAAQSLGLDQDAQSLELLSEWLAGPPDESLFHAWRGYVEALLTQLSIEGRVRLEETVLVRARSVAQAAGGVAGLRRVSRSEELVLERLAVVFQQAGD
ncbi:MAG: MMPL family transporter [bacterium]|nr:MMPL family transporter [bacterium]